MTSNDTENLILKFINKNISTDELTILTHWINESDENKKTLQDFININHVVNPNVKPEQIDSEEALKQIIKKINTQQKATLNIIEWWKKVAAILIIPLIGWTIYTAISSKNNIQRNEVAYQEIISPPGTKSNITLSDGTSVWLNSGSRLKFPSQFNSGKRNVYLIGEGFFKVKSDKKHPFIVHTNQLDVKATGTEFNVDAYTNDSLTTVSLKEGVVNILTGRKLIHQMKPDDQLTYHNTTKGFNVTSVNTANLCAWKDGVLVFRDEPLENVFKRISRTYNVDIEVKDKSVAHQLYRATFEKESLDEILRLLQLSAPIKYKRSTREINADNLFNKEKIEVLKK